MSATAGWVDFSPTSGNLDPIGVMTSALAGRGPAGEGLWRSAHAALGHRSTSPSDVQPLATGNAAGSRTVLTFAGRLGNAQALRARLRSLGRDVRSDADAEVVLRAYEQWGEECAERIEGTYAFALWDERREELFLVRDRMGVKPLFYAPTEHGVLFGSEPKAILAHPGFTPAVDAGGLRDILSIARVPGHAMFRGMYEVRPGCVVRVGRGHRPSERRYWALRAGEHPDGLDKTVATVRELLETVVAEQFGPAGEPPASLLSGGLDSSSLTALAARTASGLGTGPVRSLAVNDQDAEDPDGTSGNEDHAYARLMAGHAGTHHHEISLAGLDLLDPRLRADVLAAYDVPINKGDQYASLLSLFRAAREHAPVALSGELGDDVFGGYNWQRFDRWVHTDTFPWVEEGRARFDGMAAVFDAGLLATLDLAAYEHDCHRDAIAEVDARAAVADPAEARHREVTYLALTRHSRVLFDRLDRLGTAAGLDIRVPFADPRLLAYTFDIPWSMKSHDGREKSVLRAALRDVLPEQVAMRVKTPYPNLRDEAYDRVLRERLAAVVRAGDSPVLPLLAEGLRQATALEGVGRAVLETALQLDDWLRTYGVRVEL
ncbi:asparagine synthase (glutamine-hydrolyzing) [Streptomyces venezuelae]|uniref:asparagine synthase (glutamine-hydrolyzing) n=1 Tax=Streptomyces venezuelae TaxID=54571 RepID=A0A5P2D477_STRVZ|nr:asparagine synthase (glutamine-hydrolyzing) [Streptomyces venezuelae]QES49964.1 asparagine synthase (glutamine-hydrolyzing) [Streptomyces venezuelae]